MPQRWSGRAPVFQEGEKISGAITVPNPPEHIWGRLSVNGALAPSFGTPVSFQPFFSLKGGLPGPALWRPLESGSWFFPGCGQTRFHWKEAHQEKGAGKVGGKPGWIGGGAGGPWWGSTGARASGTPIFWLGLLNGLFGKGSFPVVPGGSGRAQFQFPFLSGPLIFPWFPQRGLVGFNPSFLGRARLFSTLGFPNDFINPGKALFGPGFQLGPISPGVFPQGWFPIPLVGPGVRIPHKPKRGGNWPPRDWIISKGNPSGSLGFPQGVGEVRPIKFGGNFLSTIPIFRGFWG